MAKGLGRSLCVRLPADASAALGIIARRGVGQGRHLDADHLWTQEIAAIKRAKFDNAMGSCKFAGLMAKGFGHADITKHSELMNVYFPHGRADGASKVATNEVMEVRSNCRSGARWRQFQLVSSLYWSGF